MPEAPADLLAGVLRRDPAGPLLTYYDDATLERTEISATTLANWVAKTANLLVDDLGLAAGEPVAVWLPAHWQTAAVLLGLWSAGAQPMTGAAGAAVVIADEPRLAAAVEAGARDVVGLSLASMNGRLAHAPAGFVDYAAPVLAAGDRVDVAHPSGHAEVVAARARAGEFGLTVGDRLLVSDAAGVEDAVDWLLAPLAAGASVVLCRNADPIRLPGRVAEERVTATLGRTVEGARRVDR